MMRRSLVLAVAAVFAASPIFAQGDFHWKGKIAAGKEIEIKGVNGDVRAVAGSGGETEVTATRRAKRSDADEDKSEVVEHEGGVTISAVYPRQGRRWDEGRPGERGQ